MKQKWCNKYQTFHNKKWEKVGWNSSEETNLSLEKEEEEMALVSWKEEEANEEEQFGDEFGN